MLVDLVVGDAYGAGFEYAADRTVRERNNLSGYVQHPRHGIRPGCYTDDTQMSIALAEAIVAGDPWTPEALARRFVAASKRDPREGYAGGFYALLQEVRDGAELLARIRPDSDKCGAAMRAGPRRRLPPRLGSDPPEHGPGRADPQHTRRHERGGDRGADDPLERFTVTLHTHNDHETSQEYPSW